MLKAEDQARTENALEGWGASALSRGQRWFAYAAGGLLGLALALALVALVVVA